MRRLAAGIAIALCAHAAPARADDPARSAGWLQRKLETGLSQALGGTVEIGRLNVDWTGLAADVGDVSISVPAEGAPPMTATIAQGRIKLAWEGIAGIAGGRIHIAEVAAKQATFSISREWIDGWTPKKPGDGQGAVEVRIDKLTIEGADAEYADGQSKVRVRTKDLSLQGDWSTARRSLVAEVRGTAAVEAPIFAHAWSGNVHGGIRLGAGRLEIVAAEAKGTGASAELNGNVTWGAGSSFTAEGRLDADLTQLAPFLRGGSLLAGHVSGPVHIVLAGHLPIRVTLDAKTTGFRVGPVVTESATGLLTLRPDRLDVTGLDARGYDGAFTGSVGLTFAPPSLLSLDIAGRGADLARLIAFSGKNLPIASSADVTLRIEGEAASVATWTGTGTFDATPRKGAVGSRIPVRGRGRVTFANESLRVQSERLELASAAVALDFGASLASHAPSILLHAQGKTDDAAATQAGVLAILDALGVARNRFTTEPVSGAGTLRADVRAGATTRLDLDFDLAGGSWSGQAFDRARVGVVIDGDIVDLRTLSLAKGSQSIDGLLRMNSRTSALDTLEVHVRDLDLAPLLAQAGVDAPPLGRLDADLSGGVIDGVLAAQGNAHLTGTILGKDILESVDSPVRIEGGVVRLDDVVARGDGIDLRGRVLYDLDTRQASVDVTHAEVQLDRCRTIAEAGLTASGIVRAEGPLAIGPEGPSGWLSLSANDVLIDTGRGGVRELHLGDLSGSGAVSPAGLELSVQATPASAWTFDASLGWSSDLPLSAVLYFDELVLGAGGAVGQSVDVRVKGQAHAEGMLSRPKEMEIDGAFDDVTIRLGSKTLRAVEPFNVRLESEQLVAGPARFDGEGGHLEASAKAALDGGSIEAKATGNLDLTVISSLWSDLRGAGPITFDSSAGGTIDAPELQGSVTLTDGRLRLLGYAQSLEHIDAEAKLSGETLTIEHVHGVMGGGEVTATGSAQFDGLKLASYQAQLDATNITATFPEGFRGTYQGRIGVEGAKSGASITGRIDVVRGLYSKDFDVGFLGGSRRDYTPASESPFPRNFKLDVDVVAPGNVWIRNDLAKVEMQGDLHVGGELRRPELTGRVSLSPGGTVRYRDVDYRLESGTLDLTDTKRLNPYVDIRGRTHVSDYDVTLHVEGTFDKFNYELTSLPPLSSQDIISLLVTGKTLDAISASSAAAELPADMAAYYFAGLLNETFGKSLQSSLGIDQFSLTPLLLKAEGDATARVTVGKRVTDNVKVVFSQDIGSTQKQTYQVVLDATRRIRLVAESDSDTGLGGEIQYSQQFGGSQASRRSKSKPSLGGAVDPPGDISALQAVDGNGALQPDLLKKARLKVGKSFDRGAMLEGADKIRAALIKTGYLQSDVRAQAVRDPDAGTYGITYTILAGPKINAQVVRSDGKSTRSMRRTLRRFWKDTPYTPDIWEESSNTLLADLQAKGFYAAEVTWHTTDAAGVRTVRLDVDRGKPVKLRHLVFHGASGISVSKLEKQCDSLKARSLRKRLLRPDVLDQDLEAIRALYRDEGFAQVRIARPAIVLSAEGDAADVTVDIDEGTKFEIGDIAYAKIAAEPEEALSSWNPVKSGQVFSPRRLAESEQALRDKFDERGYPDARVDADVTLEAPEADLNYEVVPGGMKTVGEIAIEGNDITKRHTIAKCLTFGLGDPVSRGEFLKSQQRLYRTGLFSAVKLTFAPIEGSPEEAQRVTVKVEEAAPWTVGGGIGYDTSDGPRASALIGYNNLFGRNISVALQGLVSSQDSRGQLTFRRRRVFGDQIDSLLSFFAEQSIETGFTQWTESASIRLERRPQRNWIQFVRYQIQAVRIGQITDAQTALEEVFKDKLSAIRLANVGIGIVRDTRDDPFATTKGFYGSVEASFYGPILGSEATFAKLFLRGSWAVTFKHGSRFMTFARIGVEQPFGGTDFVPLSERFFAGGSTTMRGFEDDIVGGLVLQGLHAGGEGLLLLNEEWHFPIWKSFWGEMFLDAGNVYPTLSDFDVTDLRSSAGLGLRLETPIGPLRVEYGWKLDRQEGETPGAFVFAIGAVF